MASCGQVAVTFQNVRFELSPGCVLSALHIATDQVANIFARRFVKSLFADGTGGY